MRKAINRIGHRYGKLTVIEITNKRKNGSVLWRCLCDCGNFTEVSSIYLANKDTKSCGCLKFNGFNQAFNQKYSDYKRKAGLRKHQFNLTHDQAYCLMHSACYYCGTMPDNVVKHRNHELMLNGIDRVDNKCGYILENCVPCCKWCNQAKSTMTCNQFAELVRRIYTKWAIYE